MIQKSTLTFLLFFSIILTSALSLFGISQRVMEAYVHNLVASELECMAKNIYYESAGESFEGKVAVAQVTLNRTKNPNFPADVCSVVHQKTREGCQFSWFCEQPRRPVANKYEWQESLLVAKQALTGELSHDNMHDALFYHASYVNPDWRNYERIKQIGNHVFYRMKVSKNANETRNN